MNTEGRREIVGLGIGPSEAEPFWSGFIKGLTKRGLRGVKLVISDAHDGLRLAITRVLGATWQRCRVHWIRNALAHVPKGQHTMVAAAIRQAFLQADADAAHQTWRHVADQLRARWPKLATLMDASEHDVLAYMTFPAQHRTKLHSTNPLERLNKEVKRRADVVGIFPNEASITRLIGAVLLEQNDEWLLQCRYMQIEGMAELTLPTARRRARQTSTYGRLTMATSNSTPRNTSEARRQAEVRFARDSPLEQDGFEPSVPPRRRTHLVEMFDLSALPFREGPRVRIRLPPADRSTS